MTVITIAVPAAHIADANQLSMILGYGPADALTYRNPQWRDAAGNIYAATSAEVGPNFLGKAQSVLTRPGWDMEPYVVSMAGANRAQALVVLWLAGSKTAAPKAAPGAITAIAGMDGLAALALMGLTQTVTAI